MAYHVWRWALGSVDFAESTTMWLVEMTKVRYVKTYN